MTGATTLVTFQSITDASTDARRTAGLMNDELNQLKSDLSQLKSIWEGKTAEDYKAQQAKWDQAQADLTQVLSDISQALDHAHEVYSQGEDANASQWA